MNLSRPLSEQSCQPCQEGLKPLSSEECQKYLSQLPEWEIHDGKLERHYRFKNFREALSLVNRAGEIAEKEGHHPDLLIHDYRCAKISVWTHVVSGLTENDFILAAKINELD
jgi:4a-hydroxytetrahydrobiopterin dehydratase